MVEEDTMGSVFSFVENMLSENDIARPMLKAEQKSFINHFILVKDLKDVKI